MAEIEQDNLFWFCPDGPLAGKFIQVTDQENEMEAAMIVADESKTVPDDYVNGDLYLYCYQKDHELMLAYYDESSNVYWDSNILP